jgi:hypothetical protein
LVGAALLAALCFGGKKPGDWVIGKFGNWVIEKLTYGGFQFPNY